MTTTTGTTTGTATCTAIDTYAGPHPGCAEFAPPDSVSCGELAVRVITVHDEHPQSAEAETDTVETLCAHHADLLRHDLALGVSPGLRIVADEPF